MSVKYFQSLFDTLVTRSLSQVASYTIAIISINIYILVVVNIALTNLYIAGAPEAKAWHNQSKNQSVTLKVIFSTITINHDHHHCHLIITRSIITIKFFFVP